MTTVFGDRFDPAIELSSRNPVTRIPIDTFSAPDGFARLMFSAKAKPTDHWNLIVFDSKYHVLLHYEASDFEAKRNQDIDNQRWTGLVPVNAIVQLSDSHDATVRIASVVLYPKASAETRFFSIQGDTPSWTDLYSSGDDIAEESGASVGVLITGMLNPKDTVYVSWCCSGFMVSDDIFLTNWHCGSIPGLREDDFWADDVCSNVVVDLAWDDRVQSGLESTRAQYSCKSVLLKSKLLDFVLLRLAPIGGVSGFATRPVHIDLQSSALASGHKPLMVIHHAQCGSKMLSTKCRVDTLGISFFQHNCDTEPGASGAPIFDMDGKVVGVHHRGFLYQGASCLPSEKENEGISIQAIISEIRSKAPNIAVELGISSK